ncbi:MAG TPA: lasso peptide biosynthesis B2 protein, partial [Polyangiaceae bacterium]
AAMSRALRRLALRRHSRARLGVREIARLVHCIERSVPNPNCYPRALLTSYLCVQSGLPCDIVIGVLAPARLMHAWCSTRGQLPYEARPEHYMYQPLFVLRLSE